MSDFTATETAVLREVISDKQQQDAGYRTQSLQEFHNALYAADASTIDNASANVGDGDVGLVAVAASIGLPLTGYSPNDYALLKSWIWERLSFIRAQKFVGMP